jgi:hypothetical protein
MLIPYFPHLPISETETFYSFVIWLRVADTKQDKFLLRTNIATYSLSEQ